MRFDAVIVAAGSSIRFGGQDKLFVELCGRPVLGWSLATFEAQEEVTGIVLVCSPAAVLRAEEMARRWAPAKFRAVVPGGARRRDSVEAGLRLARTRYVAVHDGARPLVTSAIIRRCAAAAEGKPGAIAAVPVTDTVKEVRDGLVAGHPDRSRLRAAQTPQIVLRQAWLDAAAASDDDETDDAAMLARLGLEVAIAEGDAENIKITRPLDLELARAILRSRGQT